MVSPSYTLSSIVESILFKRRADGSHIYKSDDHNMVVKVVKGKPTEVLKIKQSPQSKKRSQLLYKSPATIRTAALRAQATRYWKKMMGFKRDTNATTSDVERAKRMLKAHKQMRHHAREAEKKYEKEVKSI